MQLIENKAWVVSDLLTPSECHQLLRAAEEAGIHEKESNGDSRHRHAVKQVDLEECPLSETVYNRIQHFLPKQIHIGQEAPLGIQYSPSIVGDWHLAGINPTWKVLLYPGMGHLAAHRDSCVVLNEHHQSFITVVGYLTDRPSSFGGATRLLRDNLDNNLQLVDGKLLLVNENAVLHRIEADQKGKALLFLHDLMHDGEPLKEGSPPKWVFRTDVMYKRDPESVPSLSKEQQEARRLLQQAEAAEGAGDIPAAIRLYNRAYKLDPSLE